MRSIFIQIFAKAKTCKGWCRTASAVLSVLGFVLLMDLAFPPPLAKAENVSVVVTDRNGAPLRAFPVEEGRWRLPADLEQIDPAFVRALLAYEDERFHTHIGVDALALTRASLNLAKAGRIVSGGSTITMQTARLLEPRKRTLGAKIFQIIRAVQLERRMSKDEILELYLTLAPYGGNIEGVRSASWAYFGREPRQLTPDEIALLIALPQSPEARRPDLKPKNAFKARERVLLRLADKGVIARDRVTEAQDALIPKRRHFPAIAWHATEYAKSKAEQGTGDICVPIDLELQQRLEVLAAEHSQQQDDAAQVALLVIDIPSREVLASIGSADRGKGGGWLDLTQRRRSPGSTLKPFIYAMAFEDGIAAPSTRISDLPTRFKSYQPENFDRTFRGDVTIAQALQHSLNVPAVQALESIGPLRFATSLEFAGTKPALPKKADSEVGLALALGGVGLTVQELGTLYTALGDEGRSKPLKWSCNDDETDQGVQFLMPSSAQKVVDILKSGPTPQGRMPSHLTQSAPKIAFKTGTSYGFRDAWAAGIANDLAVIVWMGRADGAPRPSKTGRKAALPILFDAFDIADQTLNRTRFFVDQTDTQLKSEVPFTLASFKSENLPPQILFPPENAEIWLDRRDRGFTLSARGEGELTWYVEGQKVSKNAYGDSIWTPNKAGFYSLVVVDKFGRQQRSNVRITQHAE